VIIFLWQVHHSFANSLIESSDEASCSSAGNQSDEDSDSSAGNCLLLDTKLELFAMVYCHYIHQIISLLLLFYERLLGCLNASTV